MKGKIVGFYGSWGSGLAQLQIDTEDGLKSIPCENAATVRALNALFPGFITDGHSIDNRIIEGQEITYEMGDMGLVLAHIGILGVYDEALNEMEKDGIIRRA